jgi:hypothetical protein
MIIDSCRLYRREERLVYDCLSDDKRRALVIRGTLSAGGGNSLFATTKNKKHNEIKREIKRSMYFVH